MDFSSGGGEGNSLDVLLRFLIDQQAQAQTLASIKEIQDAMNALNSGGQTTTGGGSAPIASTVTQMKQLNSAGMDVNKTYANMTAAEKAASDAQQEYNRQILAGITATQQDTQAKASNVSTTQSEVDAANALVAARQKDVSAARTQVMEYRTLQRAGSMLTQIGSTFFVPAAAVLAGASALAENYVKNVAEANDLTTAWKASTDSLSYSESRVGQTIAEIELPALQEASKLMDQIASFVQENPGAVSAGLDIVTAVAGIAGLAMLIGRGITLYADVKYISATFALLGAENALTAATVAQTLATEMNTLAHTGPTGALAAGLGGGGFSSGASTIAGGGLVSTLAALVLPIIAVVGGAALYDALKPKNAPTALQTIPEANADIYALFNKPLLDKLGAFGQSIEKFDQSLLKLQLGVTGVSLSITPIPIENASWYQTGESQFAAHEQKLTDIQNTYDKDMQSEADSFYKSMTDAQNSYDKQQASELRDHNEQDAQAQQDYYDSVALATRNYLESEKQAIQDYDQQRADAARNFQETEYDAQQSYLNQLADLEQSHRDKLQDLTLKHDVLGIEAENRSYNETKNKDERDYAEADAKRRQEYAQQEADAERNFEQQRERAAADFQQQQSDAKANYLKAKKQRDDAFQQQLDDQAQNFKDQKAALVQDHIDKMAQLKQNLTDQYTLEQTTFQHNMDVLVGIVDATTVAIDTAFQEFLKGLGLEGKTGNYIPPTHDYGGYFYPGMARNGTGQSEWVMSPSTTKYAESIVGGRLSQGNLLSALVGRSSITNNMSGFTAQDKLVIQDMINRGVKEQLREQFG